MITIKSEREIELMREAGKVLGLVHNMIQDYIKPGISTYEIDEYARKIIKKENCTCSFYHLYDFPANFCISINDEVIHGIPNKHKIVKDGDIVKVDGGVCYKGYHSDAARTIIVGNVSDEVKKLVEETKKAFFEAIKVAIPGNHIQDIGIAVENYIKPFGYGIVNEFTGHGIGQEIHEDPEIPNYKDTTRGPKIKEHMTFAIEPMINLGTADVYTEDDEWTVRTQDGLPSAHYENTILVTENGPEILSLV